jgi:hypothetical protein
MKIVVVLVELISDGLISSIRFQPRVGLPEMRESRASISAW